MDHARTTCNSLRTVMAVPGMISSLNRYPPGENTPLLKARNCYITPHIAWATHAARQRLLQVVVDNVASFIAGKPQNVVNGVPACREQLDR